MSQKASSATWSQEQEQQDRLPVDRLLKASKKSTLLFYLMMLVEPLIAGHSYGFAQAESSLFHQPQSTQLGCGVAESGASFWLDYFA